MIILFYLAEDPNEAGHWSTKGCWKVNETINGTICHCNHLTAFSVLFDVSQSGYNPVSLQVITWIGCGISLAGLTVTVIVNILIK